MRQLATRGAGATLLSGGVGLAVQMIATVVLARLLTPVDFGVVAMVTTFSLLLTNFGLNGFTESVLQHEDINHFLASNLFWINLGTGLLLAIGFGAAGSILARFYNDPRVAHVAVGMSVTIFLSSLSVLHLALLKRAMRFSALSANDLCARTISVALSIVLGWAGWGYWALVAGCVVLPLSASVGAWALCPWVPGLPRRADGTGSMVRFAISVYGRFAVNYSTRNMDNLLVGWRFSAFSLGFYKKAYDLFALPATQLVGNISVVAISALSRLRGDQVEYRRYFLGALSVLAFLGMGMSGVLTLVGKDLIRVLLGPKWDVSGRIFTLFAPGIGAMLIYATHGWIHLSIGRADRWLRWGIVEVTVTGLLFLLALPWGPAGIAVAWAVSFWILTIPAFWYAGKPIGFRIGPVVASVWRYILASLVAGLVSAAIIEGVPSLVATSGSIGSFAQMVVVSFLFGILYVGVVILLHGGYAPIHKVLKLLQEMVPWEWRLSSPVPASRKTVESAILALTTEKTSLLSEGGSKEAAGDVGHGAPPVGSGTTPLVSILIPAFNAQEWIADALRSAIAQTWQRKEIIVVDDGSTDQTHAIARQFEPQGVLVVRQENMGASAARNKAFLLCHGDYIQWLDADDLLAPDKIAKQMDLAKQGVGRRTLLSSAWASFMYRPHRAQLTPTALWCDLSPVEWLLRKMGQNIYMQTATWLVSRELTEAVGPWDTRLSEDDDGEYFCRVLLASNGVRFVQDAKVYYRTFGFDSLSYIGRSPRKIESHWLSMQLHILHLRSLEESPRVHAECVQYLRTSLLYFYPERRDIVSQAEQMAMGFGARLGVPSLSWKYSWIEVSFGWGLVKPIQRSLRKFRWSMEKRWDWLLSRIENRNGLVFNSQGANQDPMAAGPAPFALKGPGS